MNKENEEKTKADDNTEQIIEEEIQEESFVLTQTKELIQRFNEDKKLRDIVTKFDKAAKDFSLKDLIQKNLEMFDEVEKANKERDEYLTILQRFKADFENYKKRSQKQASHNVQLSSERILSKVFEPIEDISRAINFAQEKDQDNIPLDGIAIIYNKLYRVLTDEGVEEINPNQGDAFDPKYHEAVVLDKSGKYGSEVVVQVFEKGYMLKERVLRAAKVMVSEANKKVASEETEEKQKENIEE
ncbi:MAG: nucleotide exchange factor GrpE [Asgard group archaeon]|nr:nucleotide exchange factor GrpE [Asgard group archaeon]